MARSFYRRCKAVDKIKYIIWFRVHLPPVGGTCRFICQVKTCADA